jgi:hypothetical protein
MTTSILTVDFREFRDKKLVGDLTLACLVKHCKQGPQLFITQLHLKSFHLLDELSKFKSFIRVGVDEFEEAT